MIIKEAIELKLKDNEKIYDVFLINQPYDDNVFLIIQNQKNEIKFYHIHLFDLKFSLEYNKTIYLPKDIFPNTISLKKIGYLNHIYYFLTNNNTLLKMIKHEDNKWSTQYIQTPNNNKILDFVICQKTIYSLIENIGLVIYKIGDKFVSNITYHLNNMIKLEHYINIFNGNEFVGILFTPKNDSFELFIELLINNELYPQVNKIILSSPQRNIKTFYQIDHFFNYFYDKNSKEMIYIRKAMLNSIPDIMYKFNLNKINETIEDFSSIIDISTHYHFPLLLSKSNFFLISNISVGKHKLNCTFYNDGNFKLIFIQRGEICAESLEESINNPYATCQKIVTYNFHVYDSNFKFVTLSIAISIGILILCFLILIIIIICGNHWMKNFNNNVNKIIIKDKKSFYDESDMIKQRIQTTIYYPSFYCKNEKSEESFNKDNNNITGLSNNNITINDLNNKKKSE